MYRTHDDDDKQMIASWGDLGGTTFLSVAQTISEMKMC